MNKPLFIPELASKVEIAQDYELKLAGIYADIAKKVVDPTLQTLIYSLSGDAYGHYRTLAIIQTLTENPAKIPAHSTLLPPHTSTKKSSFLVKTTNADHSGKGGESKWESIVLNAPILEHS